MHNFTSWCKVSYPFPSSIVSKFNFHVNLNIFWLMILFKLLLEFNFKSYSHREKDYKISFIWILWKFMGFGICFKLLNLLISRQFIIFLKTKDAEISFRIQIQPSKLIDIFYLWLLVASITIRHIYFKSNEVYLILKCFYVSRNDK